MTFAADWWKRRIRRLLPTVIERQTCPRRREAFGRLATNPTVPGGNDAVGLDGWEPNRGLISQPRGCTYCGSLPPTDLLEALRNGAQLSATDKDYKVYVEGMPGGGHAKFYTVHLSPEQGDELRALIRDNEATIWHAGYRPRALYVPTVGE